MSDEDYQPDAGEQDFYPHQERPAAMSDRFFVMIHTQRGNAVTPLTRGGEVAMFDSQQEALEAANFNDMASCFGFDVFQMGCGCEGESAI